MNRQKKSLLTLFVVLLLAIGYSFWMMPEQQRISKSAAGSRSESTVNIPNGTEPVRKNRLRVDLLEKVPMKYKGYNRDIFNYVVVNSKSVPRKPPKSTKVIKAPPEQRTPVVTTIVRQQLARFTFLGFLIKDELHTVFLSRDEDLFLVQENDQFGDDKQFSVLSISPELMSISQAGDSRTIDIKLIEKEPLMPTMQKPGVSAPTRPTSVPSAQNKWPRGKPPAVKR